jgi:uncharacterized metal-binding protein YceD (DUF177 family)
MKNKDLSLKNEDLPFSRPFDLRRLSPKGFNAKITATEEECGRIAQDFKIEAIRDFKAELHLTGDERRARIKGYIEAYVTQNCVVTLDPFESSLRENINLRLYDEAKKPHPDKQGSEDEDYDIIKNGMIDLGAIMTEFLALGLPAYPRKPDNEA